MRLINFLLLYILFPVLIVLFTIKTGDKLYLLGLALYIIGLLIAKFKQWIFLPIPIFFCMWYWYTFGFSLLSYVSFCFWCFAAAIIVNQASAYYFKMINKVLPEQLTNLAYNEKVEEFDRRLKQYRLDHPEIKITPEIVEKIRTDVFFS